MPRDILRILCNECRKVKSREGHTVQIWCHKCRQPYHITCVGWSTDVLPEIDKFYCPKCTERYELLTTWLNNRHPRRGEKTGIYYRVKKITDHAIDEKTGERYFEIKWLHFRECTVEPEENLDGALELLQEYCRKQALAPSTIDGLIGKASKEDIANLKCWATIGNTLKVANRYICDTSIKLTRFDKLEKTSDKLFLYDFEQHAYVGLYIAEAQTCYIADGYNKCMDNPGTYSHLRSIIDMKLVCVKFNQQLRRGFCASSAAAIAIVFSRWYKSKFVPQQISIGNSTKRDIIKALHKEKPTKVGKSDMKSLEASQVKCQYCNRRFWVKSRGIRNHLNKCKLTAASNSSSNGPNNAS